MASLVRNIQEEKPADRALADAYSRGFQKGKESQQMSQPRILEMQRKVELYEKINDKFRLWQKKDEELDRIFGQFEKFRKVDLNWLDADINCIVEKLQKLHTFISGEA